MQKIKYYTYFLDEDMFLKIAKKWVLSLKDIFFVMGSSLNKNSNHNIFFVNICIRGYQIIMDGSLNVF